MELQRFWQVLEHGGELFTQTSAQARFLINAWLSSQAQPVQQRPAIRPLQSVLQSWFLQTEHRRRLMSTAAARRLWQQIISEDELQVSNPRALARMAMDADRLMFDYDIKPPPVQDHLSLDEASFLNWQRRYDQRLRETGWIDPNRLWDFLQTQALPSAGLIGWFGFGVLTPRIQALRSRLSAGGVVHRDLPPIAHSGQAYRCITSTDDQEWEAIIDWLKQQLANNPRGRYVVQDESLADHWLARQRQVGQGLLGTVPSADDWMRAPVRFVDGVPLSQSKVVADALAVLDCLKPRVSREALSRVFKSRYFVHEDGTREALLRAELALWTVPASDLSADHWLSWFKSAMTVNEPVVRWLQNLRRGALHRQSGDASFWAEQFLKSWRSVGWPKGAALAQTEHDAAQSLQHLLEEFAQSAPWMGSLSIDGAVTELRQLIAEQRLDIGSVDAPIQIMSRWEDLGVPVDGLWVAGLRAESFPKSPRALPFIRAQWENAALCPTANAAQAKAEAQQLRDAWDNHAPCVVYSASLSDGRSSYTPALTIADLPEWVPSVGPRHAIAAIALERHAESALSPLPPDTEIRGGTRVIENQAECPFKAALDYRLRPSQWAAPEYGISSKIRGNWLHAVLKEVWDWLTNHATLCATPSAEVQRFVAERIERHRPTSVQYFELEALLDVEAERLATLVLALLEFEKTREPFRVEARESVLSNVVLAGHRFTFRLDRVDALVANPSAPVLIDYKSGEYTAPQWDKNPPTPVQLPVYAAVHEAAVGGMALVFPANTDKPFAARGEVGLAKSKPLADLLPTFKPQIEALVRSFAAGEAIATPSPTACAHCAYELVCRVKYQPLAEPDDGDLEITHE